jgi:hypothetical protein
MSQLLLPLDVAKAALNDRVHAGFSQDPDYPSPKVATTINH